jgi:hypothetical protein
MISAAIFHLLYSSSIADFLRADFGKSSVFASAGFLTSNGTGGTAGSRRSRDKSDSLSE